MATGLENPILNSPYDAPAEHFEVEPGVGPTGVIKTGRRPSESFIPIPLARKGKATQAKLAFDGSERAERNALINDIRDAVDLWRARGYPGASPISRKLMQHWGDPTRENRVLFCQREAAETAIFLAEAAGRKGNPDFRRPLDENNRLHNDGLPRVGLKMATGSGKTVVMAMLIAWQTINKVYSPHDARYAKRFLIITPGITIRDRLRVLNPGDDGNYFRERDLVPSDLWGALVQAEIAITNYHSFLPRTAKEMQGVSSTTKKILLNGRKVDPFVESDDQIVSRVLRGLSGRGAAKGKAGEVVVFNDEAHHCYQDKPLEDIELDAETKKEAKERNESARVWFKGVRAVHRKVGVKAVYDLSATPFYLSGSGYNEGYIFPWVVSDFSLMDAIESGIVKVPRVPVDDDATNVLVSYLHLWDHIGKELPKARPRKKEADEPSTDWVPPSTLEGALKSLYRSYEQAFARWEATLANSGETPPVFIVVCPNTFVSKVLYDWIAGADVMGPDEVSRARSGKLPLFSNVDDNGRWIPKPRTILVDSAQLESGEAMKDDFKRAAGHEIEQFKDEYRRRNPGADVDKITDEDLLREVMNTVGKKDRLGEGVRCVVSVSMLTEGWDANTVTHILGIRRFGSQLLCEQVVGRGLRRRSYELNEDGKFDAEYAEVYGVPFQFIGGNRPGDDKPKPPATHVRALLERAELRIEFPNLDGYRVELFDAPLSAEFIDESKLHVDKTQVATWTRMEGIAGEAVDHRLEAAGPMRPQQIAFEIADTVLRKFYGDRGHTPWLFPRLLEITKQWLATCVTYEPNTGPAFLSVFAEAKAKAAERVHSAIVQQVGNQREMLQPLFRRFDAAGSTDDVNFFTRKHTVTVEKSHVNVVVLDGPSGNTWEETMADLLGKQAKVEAFVKNDHVGFEIPYVHAGRSHRYLPDFLVRLVPDPDTPDVARTLIVEVSGGRKLAGPTKAKAETARQWCQAVNNHGGYGHWGYTEITDMAYAESNLNNAITSLYGDGPGAGELD